MSRRWLAVVCAVVAPFAVAASSSAQVTSAAPSSSTSASASASTTSSAPSTASSEEPEEPEVELIDLSDEPEPDPQALAIGVQAGGGILHTHGSIDTVVPAADFAFTFDVGLGPGGARAPWSLEPYAAFAVTRATLSSTVNNFPDRYTEIGARFVFRPAGTFQGHWVSFGAGIVFTDWGSCNERGTADQTTGNTPCLDRHDLAPAPLVDLGLGVQEWTTRFVRYGIALRAPVELSSHWGIGAFVAFYAQVGFRR